MSLLAFWGWDTHLSSCLNQHLLEQIKSPEFPLIIYTQKTCKDKSMLIADKSSLSTTSVGLFALMINFLSSLSPCLLKKYRYALQGTSWKKMSTIRCFRNCPQWDTVPMTRPEKEEIMATLPVEDPFTETRDPHVHQPWLVNIKNQWIKSGMFLKCIYLKAINRNQLVKKCGEYCSSPSPSHLWSKSSQTFTDKWSLSKIIGGISTDHHLTLEYSINFFRLPVAEKNKLNLKY